MTNVFRRGAVAGALGGAVMSVAFLLMRVAFGLPTPSELATDVLGPLINVALFVKVIGFFGGYTELKAVGFGSVIVGQLVIGALLGALFARRPTLLLGSVAGLSLITLLVFSGVLQTNYHGYPRPTAIVLSVVTVLVAYALYAGTTLWFFKQLVLTSEHDRSRAVFIAGGAAVAAAAAGALAVRAYVERATFGYDGTQYLGADVQAITPVNRFYVVTKNIADPAVERGAWRLAIDGAVERSSIYDMDQLAQMGTVVQETTLMCISNEVAGGLMSNAKWSGVRLRDVISAAGPMAGVRKVSFHAVDNYVDTISFDKAMEPTTLIAFRMNSEELPARHGFPARMIVPGMFGEKNVKWISRVSLETTDVKGFYERQGWGPDFSIPTHSRFDAPDFTRPLARGRTVELRGVAFAGNRGVSRVEVSTDGGRSWVDASFVSPYGALIWRLWRFDWRPATPGRHELVVRATDSHGELQIAADRPTAPHGATGFHRVTAHVS